MKNDNYFAGLIQFQTDILKDVKKAQTGRAAWGPVKYSVYTGAGFTDIAIDGIIMIRIPDAARVIDFDACRKAAPRLFALLNKDFTADATRDARPAAVTDNLFALTNGKTVRAFVRESGTRLYCDTALLAFIEKYYTGPIPIEYTAAPDRFAPLIFNAANQFVALLLPVNYHETQTA